MEIVAILAMTENRLVGRNGGLPWHLPGDLRRFRELTTGFPVIMGRNTYLSLPPKFRPLPGRRNMVLAESSLGLVGDEWNTWSLPEVFGSIETLLEKLSESGANKAFVIGGASVYEQFFDRGLVDRVELTLVHGDFEGETYVREFRGEYRTIHSEDHPECSYISLIRV